MYGKSLLLCFWSALDLAVPSCYQATTCLLERRTVPDQEECSCVEDGILHRELSRPILPGSARFGSTLAIHGDRIFVGSSNDLDGDVRRGSVYAYSFTDPAFVHRVDFSDAVQFLDLGMSMASSGGLIYVGCSFIGVDGYTGGVFVVDSGTFGVVEMISSSEAAELQIGRKIAASSDYVVFADPGFYYRLWTEESGLCYILDGADRLSSASSPR
jgi:hypothetical protein